MITIAHTNDLHGHDGMLPRLAALIRRERQRSPDMLLLDAGDMGIDDSLGSLSIDILRTFGYDAITSGNHENEVRSGRAALARLGVPCLVANVGPNALGFDTPPYLMRRVDGLAVAILGLTTAPVYPIGHPLHRPNADEIPVTDPLAAAQAWVPYLRPQADLLVVLSHLGLRRDLVLARAVPGIDLIVGGHSHHRLASPLYIDDTAIVQAGMFGAYLGVVDIERAPNGFHFRSRLEPIWQDVEPDVEITRRIDSALALHLPDGLAVHGQTDGCWADPWQENAWANFVTDAFRTHSGADIAFTKASSVLPALDPGPLREWDLNCAVDLRDDMLIGLSTRGDAIRAICEHSVGELADDEGLQTGGEHRLPANPMLQCSGLRLKYDLRRPSGSRVLRIQTDSGDLDSARHYRVVTNAFLAKGYSGFHWFPETAPHSVAGSMRRALLESLLHTDRLPPIDGRFCLVGALGQDPTVVRQIAAKSML
jgi:2',3'-cyclic-nucleotide 2'-phosphodiesterase (5'-nucleotidase family)